MFSNTSSQNLAQSLRLSKFHLLILRNLTHSTSRSWIQYSKTLPPQRIINDTQSIANLNNNNHFISLQVYQTYLSRCFHSNFQLFNDTNKDRANFDKRPDEKPTESKQPSVKSENATSNNPSTSSTSNPSHVNSQQQSKATSESVSTDPHKSNKTTSSASSSNPTAPNDSKTPPHDHTEHEHHFPAVNLYEVASDVSNIILTRLKLNESNQYIKGFALISIVLGVVSFIVYLFRGVLVDRTVIQVSDVAKRTLQTDEVQAQASILTHELVKKMLTDERVLNSTVAFLERILKDPSTRNNVMTLLTYIMNDPYMIEVTTNFGSKVASNIMAQPHIRDQLAELLRNAMLDPANKLTMIQVFKDFLNDPATIALMNEKAINSAHAVFNDGNVKLSATEFTKQLLNDSSLQQTTGDALWNSVKHVMMPRWFITGDHAHSHAHNTTTPPTVQITTANIPPTVIPTAVPATIESTHSTESPSVTSTVPTPSPLPLTPIVLVSSNGTVLTDDPFFNVPVSATNIDSLATDNNSNNHNNNHNVPLSSPVTTMNSAKQ